MDIFSYFTSDINSSKIGFDDDEFGDAKTGTALSLIADAFEEISDLIKEGNAKGVSFELRLKLFCDACSLVSVLFGSVGIAFKFAEMESTSKVRDLSDAASLYGTLSKIFFGLSATELDILDIYEDEEYGKRSVDVSLMDSSEVLQAYVYVWANNVDPDLYGKGRNGAYLP